jgi:alkane 1-monooxygenase
MIRYGGSFLLQASIALFFYAFGPAAPLATVGLLLAALLGAEWFSPRGDVPDVFVGERQSRLLLHLFIPLQLTLVAWASVAAAHTSAIGVVSLALGVGVVTGVFGMLAAHEMIHSRSRAERLLGTAMLSAMAYRHFRIAHVRGHHRWAATERDAASARPGEGFYAFLVRTVTGQFLDAYRLERKRCAARPAFANRVVADIAVTAFIVLAVWWAAGPLGVVFFAAQSFVAIVVLELFNYIAHYGLQRRTLPGGTFEPFDDRHSWNSSNIVANHLIFNMGRHSYHHRKPALSYEKLEFIARAPELPAGYAASILLALVPPLWCRIMDAEIARLKEQERGDERLAA